MGYGRREGTMVTKQEILDRMGHSPLKMAKSIPAQAGS